MSADVFSFTLAVIFVVINGITQMYLAKSLGFKLKPTGLAYFVGVVGNLFTGSVVPISGQAETLTLSGRIKNINVRIAALLFAVFVSVLLGCLGLITEIADFAGVAAVAGMMAGVGYILAKVGVDMCLQEKRTGIISMVSAFAIYMTTSDLVYTIAGSVLLSTLDYCLIQGRRIDIKALETATGSTPENDEWRFWTKAYWSDFTLLRPKFGWAAITGGLSFVCLNIGSNISFGSITASFAGQEPKLNALSVINGLADLPSILFGGAPIEAIISGTGFAPNLGNINGPWLAGILMMAISGILLITGLVGKLGKYIPAQSIAGFLFIIGLNVTLIPNLAGAFATGDVVVAGAAFAITILSNNAFYGLVAGALLYKLPVLIPLLFHLMG
jgi:AGZA family xanthine/uracil permease-like MFS transporter